MNVAAESHTNRLTPRQPRSTWSAVNLQRFEALRAAKCIDSTGLMVFQTRNASADGYVIGDQPTDLDATVETAIGAVPKAWAFFQSQPPCYRHDAAGGGGDKLEAARDTRVPSRYARRGLSGWPAHQRAQLPIATKH